ncbi:MAG: 30S ribosome-binding factor RbfA [Candidatus Omnitrophota bacterium]
MTSNRAGKVAMAIKEETSRIILMELKDPRIGFVTITHVDVTPDLKTAHIFYSIMGDPKAVEASQKGLEAAKGYIRRLVGGRLKLRFTPEIYFREDDSNRQSFRITEHFEKTERG